MAHYRRMPNRTGMRSRVDRDAPRGGSGRSRRLPGLAGFVCLLCLAALAACARPPSQDVESLAAAGSAKTLDVPFFPQERYQCGPAALAEIFGYWGQAETPEDIGRAVYSDTAGGTLGIDLMLYARRRNLDAEIYDGSPENIRQSIDAGKPLVIFVDNGAWIYHLGHFMTVIGYVPDGVVAHNGPLKAQVIPFSDLERPWRKTNNWTLRITPKEQHAQN